MGIEDGQKEAKGELRGEPADLGTKKLSPCDVAALKKCLEENKGDHSKCQSLVEDFRSACSVKKTQSSVQGPSEHS